MCITFMVFNGCTSDKSKSDTIFPDNPDIKQNESIVYDDGTGANILFYLPIHDTWNGKEIEYSVFAITVVKDGKFLLSTRLTGAKTADGKVFFGHVIIPSIFIDSAEIGLSGSPPNSSFGVSKKLNVRDFKRVVRKKSWTEQE